MHVKAPEPDLQETDLSQYDNNQHLEENNFSLVQQHGHLCNIKLNLASTVQTRTLTLPVQLKWKLDH